MGSPSRGQPTVHRYYSMAQFAHAHRRKCSPLLVLSPTSIATRKFNRVDPPDPRNSIAHPHGTTVRSRHRTACHSDCAGFARDCGGPQQRHPNACRPAPPLNFAEPCASANGLSPCTGGNVMNPVRWFSALSLCVAALVQPSSAQDAPPALKARVIAVGIAGAGAVAPVGTFHAGGPIRDKPEFFAFTQPGRVLDGKRVLVASRSNFGAPRAHQDVAEGAILSIDPEGPTL